MIFHYRYLPSSELARETQTGRVQTWSFGKALRTVRKGNTFLKREFASGTELETLIAESREAGIGYPSSWGDVFHRLERSPSVIGSVRYNLDAPVNAGWEEARIRGDLPGRWYVYDITSAYAWAAYQGLPVVSSARPERERVMVGGIYLASFERSGRPLPPTVRPHRPCLLTAEEIEQFDLYGVELHRGVVFRRFCSLAQRLDDIRRRFKGWKKIYRAFWGAWISQGVVTCQTLEDGKPVKTWNVARPWLYNPAWGQSILSRVRLRVAHYAHAAAHIFVDSVMVPFQIQTGHDIGDWHLDRVIDGVNVKHPGFYGPQGCAPVKHSGLRKEEAV